MTPALKSIRWQIQIWYGLLLLVIVGAFAIIIHRLTWRDLLGKVDEEIRQNNSLILGNLRRSALAQPSLQSLLRIMHSDDENAATAMVMELLAKGELDANADLPATFADRDPGYAYFAIFDPENRLIASSANAPARIEPPPTPIQGTAITARATEDRREQALAEQSGFRLVVGQDLSPEKALMTRYRLRIVAGASATWLIVLVGGWWIAGAAIRPIRTISDAAARIAHGNLKERIPLTNSGNELHDLAMVLNDTFQRLDEAFERQRQFTADASHELRTPVTVILCEAQRMRKKARSVEEYAEAMELCHAAGRRMQKLVENLLVLARQDGEEPNPGCWSQNQGEGTSDHISFGALVAAAAPQFILSEHMAVDSRNGRCLECGTLVVRAISRTKPPPPMPPSRFDPSFQSMISGESGVWHPSFRAEESTVDHNVRRELRPARSHRFNRSHSTADAPVFGKTPPTSLRRLATYLG